MANYMAEVAKLLGVELGERFKICFPCVFDNKYNHDYDYYLSDAGVEIDADGRSCISADILHGLLCGKWFVVPKSWKPKDDERFYVILSDGDVRHKYWDDCATCKNYYKLGNCYHTKEEAEANRDKWLAFYSSDEVLEV